MSVILIRKRTHVTNAIVVMCLKDGPICCSTGRSALRRVSLLLFYNMNENTLLKYSISGFKCEECHKTFKNNRLLTYHMKTHLDLKDREIFVCDYDGCNRKYFYKRNLVHHINSFHKHIRNMIPCPHDGCDVILSRKV